MNPQRRRWLAALGVLGSRVGAQGNGPTDPVRRGRAIELPHDHGAHLDARTEWWYATGWLGQPEAPSLGFQVTFFRSRTGLAQDLPGRLAPRQLLFAHAACTDLANRRHLHSQHIVRWDGDPGASTSSRLAGAARGDLQVWIGRWSLQRTGAGFTSRVQATRGGTAWAVELDLRPTQPVLLQGDAGFSRKGPEERQASHYYSLPQLAARGEITIDARQVSSQGRAWLDHEWSDEILAADAVGWDWVGFNLFDGGALTAFQLRRADGGALWTGGSVRASGAAARIFGPDELKWRAGRRWRSPETGADYPVQWHLETPVGTYQIRALLDEQELDGRRSTGTVYWEGLSELLDASGRRVGLGYLELTGYAGRLRL